MGNLSEIARALGEKTVLKKVIERLGRQLGQPGLRQHVQENLLREAAHFVGKDTLLVVDATDLSKLYARKMEYLAKVRDGSDNTFGPGYWCMTVVAAHRSTAQIIPLYQAAPAPPAHPAGGEADLRHPGVSPLRPRRSHQAVPLQFTARSWPSDPAPGGSQSFFLPFDL